ncbi:MAG TPA: hypothetical protein VML54_11195 [Candidatus Limnocylindrales bacterium]|nr:hypothetical protein [Candidatus Limnocylindrales bacterium]
MRIGEEWRLMRHEGIGARIVPIIPDEARTFGMDALFRRFGIYSHAGQLYEPVDQESLLSYREAKDGQILEEGITEAGSMSSFIAAGTAYAQHGLEMVPLTVLGTDGFGRSDTRQALRRHFEVDAEHVAYAALDALARGNRFEPKRLPRAAEELGIDPDQPDPVTR